MERVESRFHGRTALVTGSTGGLGLAVASGLAAGGCNVVLTGLAAADAMDPVCRDLEKHHGVRATYSPTDLSRPEEIEGLVEAAAAEFGGIDIVVNNAVVRQFGPIEEMAVAGWDQSIAVNLTAAYHTIRLTLPGMRRRDFGRIVNVSSIYGMIGAANRADYVTTKTALLGLTRAVALETAETGITCNAICPGTVPTDAITAKIGAMALATGRSEEAETRDYLASRQPTRRFVATDGVVATVVFLCGAGARDITGATMPIDGAWSVS